MAAVIAILNLFFFIIACSFSRRGIINPASIFHGVWCGLFLIFSVRSWLFPGAGFSSLDNKTSIYYLVVFVSFFLGASIAYLVKNILFRDFRLKTPYERESSQSNNIISIYLPVKFLCFLSLIGAFVAFFLTPYSFVDYLRSGEAIRAAITLDYNPMESLVSLITSYVAWVVLPVTIFAIVKGAKEPWLYFPIVALVANSLLTLGKFNILLALVFFLNSWLLAKPFKFSQMTRMVKPFALAILILIGVFYGSAALRGIYRQKLILMRINFQSLF